MQSKMLESLETRLDLVDEADIQVCMYHNNTDLVFMQE